MRLPAFSERVYRMTETQLRDAIKTGPSGGYLLWGDEDYLKRFYLAELKKAALRDCPEGLLDFNCIRLAPEDGDFSALQDALNTPPMMAPMKFVEITPPAIGTLKDKERKALAEILDGLASMPDTVLVMVCPRDTLDAGTQKKPNATYKMLTSYLEPVEFPLQTGAKLRRWVMRHFAEEGVAIDEATCDFLLGRCAPDMTTLSREIDKVICYEKAVGRPSVTVEDVEFVTSAGVREDAFALANAVLAGDRTAALASLDICKKRKEEPIAILASLLKVMSDLLTVATLQAEGAERADIARALKMHEYKAGLYMKSAAGFGVPRITAALNRCLAADRLMKSASMGYIPLERFVCTIPMGNPGGKRGG